MARGASTSRREFLTALGAAACAGAFPPVVRDVEVRNVTSRKSQYVLLLRGFPQDPIQDARLVDCTFEHVEKPDLIEAVNGLTFTNVRVNGQLRR
jgi:hypothetical protein